MAAVVDKVLAGSIAEELEIKTGDELLSIDEQVPSDMIDYQFMTSSSEITVHIKHKDGLEEIIEIEKDPDEDLGIQFESAVFDKIKPCSNKCIFCFVDQQPDGLRDSLYVKDDDYRLSYLQGTYITLTNLSDKDRQRIENLRVGPLYVSVHSTNPEVRQYMLKNPKAQNIMQDLKWLNELDIPVHAQVVLCPGVNDAAEFERTLGDLALLKSNIASIAVVPVGITKYRPLNELVPVDAKKAKEVISQVDKLNKELGYKLAFASDEFYILASEQLPDYESYNDFAQLDDGVGALRVLLDDFNLHRQNLPKSINKPHNITFATGEIAYDAMSQIAEELNKVENLSAKVIAVKSRFWGEDITVSGLITGNDLIESLKDQKNIGTLMLPSVLLRQGTQEFLDGIMLEEVEKALGADIIIVEDYYSTQEIVDYINSL